MSNTPLRYRQASASTWLAKKFLRVGEADQMRAIVTGTQRELSYQNSFDECGQGN